MRARIATLVLVLYFLGVSCEKTSMETDVLVIGGGSSGVAAALSSAREGAETTLLEEGPWLGGMLTAAGVSAVDGNTKLPSGIWGEFRDSLINRYGSKKALQTGWVSNHLFEPSVGNQIFQNMVKNQPLLKPYFGAKVIAIEKKEKGWKIEFSSSNQTFTLFAKIVIDATELGDIAARVGIPYDIGMDSRQAYGEDIAPEKENDVIQDLTYVMILKDHAKDMTIEKPEGYDPEVFYCASESDHCKMGEKMNRTLWPKDSLLSYGRLPNGKVMINWPINGNDYYTNAIEQTEEERHQSFEKAKLKSLQFLYYLQTELGFNTYGLVDDEFPTDDGFPLIPYHRESRRIHGITTLTVNHIAQPYDQQQALYRTGIAVGDYPVDHHHASHPDAENLPELHFYPVPSYNLPMGCLLPQSIDDFIVAEKSISVTNIVNGTTRLQPVVLQIGQAAGAIAALSIKENLSPAKVSVRKVQNRLLEQGGYLLPYLDVPKDHPRFKVYQRIGATGILKGTGMNVGWENQTWFFPDKELTQPDLDHALSVLKKFKDIPPPVSTKNQDMLQWFKKLHPLFSSDNSLPDWIKDTKTLNEFLGIKVAPMGNISRGNFALLLDVIIDPFHRRPIDHYGQFVLDQ
ncbi:MAG: FAD-dependent oxidoreductase [Flavobacteriaceae bacterium]